MKNTAKQWPLFLALVWLSGISAAQPSPACSCLWEGPFIRTQAKSDLIVTGTIIGAKGNSLDLQIDRVLQDNGVGQREFREVIRLWGNNGKLCRPDTGRFALNSQYLLGLKKITELPEDGFNPNTPNISFGRVGDYYLSSCGVYWLDLNEGRVSGPLAKAERWQWSDETMNPVLLELVAAYISGMLPEQALIEAAKPQTEAKQLLEQTKAFLREQ